MTFLQSIGILLLGPLLHGRIARFRFARKTYVAFYSLGKLFTDRREVAFLRRVIKPGMVVVDVGAHVGFFAELLSELVGSSGRVIAFEPDPLCAGILRERIASLPRKNTAVHPRALSSTESEGELHISPQTRTDNRLYVPQGEGWEGVKVSRTTFDAFVTKESIDRVDFVKIDVQGGEVGVLQGMCGTLKNHPPRFILIEFSPAHLREAGSDPLELLSILTDAGYQLSAFDGGSSPMPITDTAGLLRRYENGYTDIWAERSLEFMKAA